MYSSLLYCQFSHIFLQLALKSLANNIGQALYKEQVQLEEMVRKMPMLRSARELEYGFSVLDKKNPNTMFKPSDKDVFVIPPEEETRMPAQEAAAGLKKIGDNFKNSLLFNLRLISLISHSKPHNFIAILALIA